jgi:hypothetical protein
MYLSGRRRRRRRRGGKHTEKMGIVFLVSLFSFFV